MSCFPYARPRARSRRLHELLINIRVTRHGAQCLSRLRLRVLIEAGEFVEEQRAEQPRSQQTRKPALNASGFGRGFNADATPAPVRRNRECGHAPICVRLSNHPPRLWLSDVSVILEGTSAGFELEADLRTCSNATPLHAEIGKGWW